MRYVQKKQFQVLKTNINKRLAELMYILMNQVFNSIFTIDSEELR